MIETFTKNDVVAYVYNETKTETKENIDLQRLINSSFDEQVDELESTLSLLDEKSLSPSNKTLESIMRFASSQHEAIA